MSQTCFTIGRELMLQFHRAGFKILYYQSISTNSFYIKLDYGVANTVRIADHKAKKHLRYKFNLRLDRTGLTVYAPENTYPMRVYGHDKIERLVDDVIKSSKVNKLRYGKRYTAMMVENKSKVGNKKGFWKECSEYLG